MKTELEKLFREECLDPPREGVHITDKGTVHDYIDVYYGIEFEDKRESVTDILEIGVFYGGSLIMWHKWFHNANIEGIENQWESLKMFEQVCGDSDYPRINIHIGDAYDKKIANSFEDNTYDYIIDDGPHTLESMKDAITLYMRKLKDGGKMVIEDVQSPKWFKELEEHAAQEGWSKFRTFDFRLNKNRSDDLIFEITK